MFNLTWCSRTNRRPFNAIGSQSQTQWQTSSQGAKTVVKNNKTCTVWYYPDVAWPADMLTALRPAGVTAVTLETAMCESSTSWWAVNEESSQSPYNTSVCVPFCRPDSASNAHCCAQRVSRIPMFLSGCCVNSSISHTGVIFVKCWIIQTSAGGDVFEDEYASDLDGSERALVSERWCIYLLEYLLSLDHKSGMNLGEFL